MTMNSRPAMPSQTRWLSAGSKTRIRWKIPEKIIRTPSRTASTFSEPVGWKLTMTPRIKVRTPRNNVACHIPAITPGGGGGGVPYSSETIEDSPETIDTPLFPISFLQGERASRHLSPRAGSLPIPGRLALRQGIRHPLPDRFP